MRKRLSQSTQIKVLTESGYRCAVPTCRGILALDLHHIEEVANGGSDDPSNLIALCPTCHALYTRGTIARESIEVWKGVLVALSHAFDQSSVDLLLFLAVAQPNTLAVSGDAVLKCANLIAGGYASYRIIMQNGPMVTYTLLLTDKGRVFVDAWRRGDRVALQA